MATYAQLKTTLINIAGYVYFNLQNVIGAGSDTWATRGDTLIDNLAGLSKSTKDGITSDVNGATDRLAAIIAEGEDLFTRWRIEYGIFINSRGIGEGGGINNSFQLQRDINDDLKNTQSKKTVARGITFASDPADDAAFAYLRRLTVDHESNVLEAGKRNQTITVRSRNTAAGSAGEGRVTLEIVGQAGGENELDYKKGSGTTDTAALDLINERNSGVTPNAKLDVQNLFANGDAVDPVTNPLVGNWVMSDEVGTPTVVVRTTNLWRSKIYGLAVSGQTTTWKITQAIQNAYNSAFDPVLPANVVYWDGTWAGTIKLDWGSKSQTFTSAAVFTAGAGFYLISPDLDADLYATNWDEASAQLAVETATTSATGELVHQFFGLLTVRNRQGGARHQGLPYFAMSAASDPGVDDSKTYVDTNAFTGIIADMYALCNEEQEWAYFSNVSGTNITDPS